MNNQSTEERQNKPRRRLLAALATGGGVCMSGSLLPSRWTEPLVDAVVLPVHAQTTCSPVDDEYFLDPGDPCASVAAPGVLENDNCSRVVDFGDVVELEGGSVTELNVDPDGSFDYCVDNPATRFGFRYTTESGETAAVIVNHDFNKRGP